MSVNLFGGQFMQPALLQYAHFSLTAANTPLQLFWSNSYTMNTNLVGNVTSFVQDANDYVVILPDATKTSVGTAVQLNNRGSFTFTVQTFDQVDFLPSVPNSSYQLILSDNTTIGGAWEVTPLGPNSPSPTANSLAGYGLIPLPISSAPFSDNLNTNIVTSVKASNFSVATTDRASLIVIPSGASVTTVSLQTNPLPGGFYFALVNEGTLPISLNPGTGTINGTTGVFNVNIGASYWIVCQAPDVWNVFGDTGPSSTQSSATVVDVTGKGSQIFLTALQAAADIIIIQGTLAQQTTIYFPLTVNQWTVLNTISPLPFDLYIEAATGTTPVGGGIGLLPNASLQAMCTPSLNSLVEVNSPLYGGSAFYIDDGSAADPSIALYAGNPTINSGTGLYFAGSPTPAVGLTVAGTSIAEALSTGFTSLLSLVAPNVPAGIASAPLGAAVINALVSSVNQATLGGNGILQMKIFTNSTQSSTTSAAPFFVTMSITPTYTNSRIIVMGIGYWAFATTTAGTKWGFMNLTRNPTFAPSSVRTIESMASSDNTALTDRSLNSTPFFFVDSGLTAATPYQYILTGGVQSGFSNCTFYFNRTPNSNPITTDTTSFCILMEVGGF